MKDEKFDGENHEERNIPETPPSENNEVSNQGINPEPSMTPPIYNNTAENTEPRNVQDSSQEPPEFESTQGSSQQSQWGDTRPPVYQSDVYSSSANASAYNQVPPVYNGNRINMQVQPKKKRKWLPIMITVIVIIYVALTAVIITMLAGFFMNGNISIDRNNGKIEITTGKENTSKPNSQNDAKVEEHLKIENTPSGKDSTSANGKMSIKDIAKKVRASVVGVIGEGGSDFGNSSVGSGIIMTADGYIITNNHVVEGSNKIQIVLDNGKNYKAQVIGTDPRTDLAVLKIDEKGLPAAAFGDSDKLEQGDVAVAIGNPAGIQLQNSVTSGIISAINRDIIIEDREMTLIQTDASINPGNSGGPLVNEYGQVIGINTIKIGISYYEGLGFAIPINTVKPIIDELISRGYIKGRPSIGITGTTLSKSDAMMLDVPEGMYVEFVHPYSDAYKKGLQRGDIIVKMNGTSLTSTEEVKKIRDKFKAGQAVTLTIFRAGKTKDISVVLMDEAELNKIGTPSQGRAS